jgi:prepilin-type N-terminal cleavage/methylation domain-containing protein
MHRRRPGFSLFEVVIALVVAAVGLLAVVGVDAVAWRRRTRADLAVAAALAARVRAERIASLACDTSASGTLFAAGRLAERWTVTHGARGLLLVTAVAYHDTERGLDSAVVHGSRWCE